jgi:TATA-box binding protein (TBP) (component of TFIID and TFIIIB)
MNKEKELKDKKQKKPELSFDDICISTETIIATTNWKVDIIELAKHLPVTHHTVVLKKRGRKSKHQKEEEKVPELNNGEIVTLRIGNQLRGVQLKEKKNSKRFFRNSLTIIMYIDHKFINFKVSKNGKFQFTGCKNEKHAQLCMKYIYEYTRDTENIIHVNGQYTQIMFVTVMTNINFNVGFCINREMLDEHINNYTKYYSLLETSFGYTGVNIKIPLENLNEMPISKISYKTAQWIDEDFTYTQYFETLDEKEKAKEKAKVRYNTFLVFQSGNVILSSPHKNSMRETYHEFLDIIKSCKDKIEEKII